MKFDPKTLTWGDLDRIARKEGQLGKVATGKGLLPHQQSSLEGRAGSPDQKWRRLPAPSEAQMRAALEADIPAVVRRSARERFLVLANRLREDGEKSMRMFGYPVWPASVQRELKELGFKVGNPDLASQVEALARKYVEEGARKQKAKDDRKTALDWHGHLTA